jgi:hypothetical protein
MREKKIDVAHVLTLLFNQELMSLKQLFPSGSPYRIEQLISTGSIRFRAVCDRGIKVKYLLKNTQNSIVPCGSSTFVYPSYLTHIPHPRL